MDLENPEVERIRKDFEMYRLNTDNEMANCQKKERKLETENKRLRAELLALQKTCTRMRAERDAALEAEQEALARASVFECERDKVQRQFKVKTVTFGLFWVVFHSQAQGSCMRTILFTISA